MAQIQEIPRLVSEFYELSRAYLIQETVEPAKKLGHFAGFSVGAAVLWAAALVLLAVAGLRALYDLLPDGAYWEALAYVITASVVLLFLALVVKLVPTRGVHEGPTTSELGDPQ
ncbi:MAG: hypothetical protein ACR2N7_10525 [Acidimicrobiia bacterium]